jgi:hypothetical protein
MSEEEFKAFLKRANPEIRQGLISIGVVDRLKEEYAAQGIVLECPLFNEEAKIDWFGNPYIKRYAGYRLKCPSENGGTWNATYYIDL